jgi:hypothetical protein
MTLFFVILLSCRQNETKVKYVNKDSIDKENLRYTLINDTSETKWIVDKGLLFWKPNQEQNILIDSIINAAAKKIYKKTYRYLSPDSISRFYRQYVCFVDSNGDSIVFVNALCHIFNDPVFDKNNNARLVRADWQHHLIIVHDGGDCFWRIWINYSKKKYFRFSVN